MTRLLGTVFPNAANLWWLWLPLLPLLAATWVLLDRGGLTNAPEAQRTRHPGRVLVP